ncbi:MAG: hypothetical protein AVDCRST_MAG69-2065, partial [uncultured Solirubrobacteraceae bacterium]
GGDVSYADRPRTHTGSLGVPAAHGAPSGIRGRAAPLLRMRLHGDRRSHLRQSARGDDLLASRSGRRLVPHLPVATRAHAALCRTAVRGHAAAARRASARGAGQGREHLGDDPPVRRL